MCGIVGAVAQRRVTQILIAGLKRLAYRGYDSAGIAVLTDNSRVQRLRCQGKVSNLEKLIADNPIDGNTGIAHTRWATHGQPSQHNAHPHCSEQDKIAVVHNGIIENHQTLRQQLLDQGYEFKTETDSEVIVHSIDHHYKACQDMMTAIQKTIQTLKGAFALGIISCHEPHCLYAVRSGSPLVVGVGIGEYFIASDPLALQSVTQEFIDLHDGDIAKITTNDTQIYDKNNQLTQRNIEHVNIDATSASKGRYRHFMLKEIFEQPQALTDTLKPYFSQSQPAIQYRQANTTPSFNAIERIHLIACGTSYHAALVGQYWLESICKIPCRVDIASEQRYRPLCIEDNTLFLCLSQSGETADTLAALRQAKQSDYASTLAICNVASSSLARESDALILTYAGREIGVAATKTFTAQLAALLSFTLALAKERTTHTAELDTLQQALHSLPTLIKETLKLDSKISQWAEQFINKNFALFVGRGIQFPIALEGALKLKEISYCHAEAYPAGELKHGPLALVDRDTPVIVTMPNNHLTTKLAANLEEIQARNGQLFIFADETLTDTPAHAEVITVPHGPDMLTPFLYTIPLQLLSYHIAVLKGTDIDQPRNLAKSVTVE